MFSAVPSFVLGSPTSANAGLTLCDFWPILSQFLSRATVLAIGPILAFIFNENTASKRLLLEGDRKVRTVEKVEEKPERRENEDRFKRSQVFCVEGLKELCYWEVEWSGTVCIAVAYKRVGRKWDSSGGLGCNEMSWGLYCSGTDYTAMHGKIQKCLRLPSTVLLDWEGGILSYYSVSSEKLSLIHTFHAKFTEPLFPAFWFKTGSVTLNHCG
uniref:B30.2/SPRY domain-containing protein n=1 Tax=Neolamprologus brichardi TaxID=32507 RepID=A0A3Q4FYW1_NEOBR